MKTKPYHIVILIIAFAVALTSCQKGANNLPTVELTGLDTGKTISIRQGQAIKVTLGNPGDGGYDFDAPKYNPSALTLVKHVRIPPVNSNMIGDFGKDSWEFSAVKMGTSAITITASRAWEVNSPVVMFTGTIAVR